MTWYRCKTCGFTDIKLGMIAHLAKNEGKCTNNTRFVMKDKETNKVLGVGDVRKYTTEISDEDYNKELQTLHELHLKQEKEKQKPSKPVTHTKEDGKTYTETGFEVLN